MHARPRQADAADRVSAVIEEPIVTPGRTRHITEPIKGAIQYVDS